MTTSTPAATRTGLVPDAAPDPAWRGLYIAGGISAMLYVLLAILVPAVMTATVENFWDILVDAPALLAFIADNTVTWHVMQALVLESSIFPIVTFAALLVALWHVDRAQAVIGAVVSVVVQVLFMAYYPVLLGLAYLGGEFATATAERQAELSTAADALIAQNSGFNPVYEGLMGAGILFLGLAMLKGVFPRWLGYLGIATFVASVVALSLYPIIGLAYFLWWGVFIVWFVAVGWKLYRLGRT